jgi:hypothetical protein
MAVWPTSPWFGLDGAGRGDAGCLDHPASLPREALAVAGASTPPAAEAVSLFTTIAVIGDAHDLTLAELRLETFWPVDEESAERWKRLVAHRAR